MTEDLVRPVADVAAGVVLLAISWAARRRQDRLAVLVVAVAWWLGSISPQLVALQRGAVAILLLTVNSQVWGRRRGSHVIAVAAALVLSLPGLPPVVAAGIFAAVGVVVRRAPGPRARACTGAAALMAAVEAAVAVAERVGQPWALLAALIYVAAVPTCCWLAVAPTGWPRRGVITAVPTDEALAANPFAAVTAVLRESLHDRELAVRPAASLDDSPGAGTRLTVEVHGRPWAVVSASPGVLMDPGTAAAVRASIERVGEHAVLVEQLRRHNLDLTASRSRLLDAADHEREVIGPVVDRVVLRPLDEVADDLRDWPELQLELRTTVTDIQAVLAGYPPIPLGDGQLVLALQSVGSRWPVHVIRRIDPTIRAVPAVETVLYAVAAEALTNVAKHATASKAELELARRGAEAILRVTDDGVGGARTDGAGLHALALRVEARGGRLHVAELVPRGTTVEALVPLDPVERPA